LTVNLPVSVNTVSAPIGPSAPIGRAGGGPNAVHDCQSHAFDQRVIVTRRREACDTSGLLPSLYAGGRARKELMMQAVIYINGVDGPPMESLE